MQEYVRSRAARGFGPQRILLELGQRGVDPALAADRVWAEDMNWTQHAARVRSKRFGGAMPRDVRERARQVRFLEYRGFTTGQARQTLRADED